MSPLLVQRLLFCSDNIVNFDCVNLQTPFKCQQHEKLTYRATYKAKQLLYLGLIKINLNLKKVFPVACVVSSTNGHFVYFSVGNIPPPPLALLAPQVTQPNQVQKSPTLQFDAG